MALFDYYTAPEISQKDFDEKVPNLYKLNNDVLSSSSFATVDWNNNPITIPSVSETRKFNYLLDNQRMQAIIRPKTRDFLILTMDNHESYDGPNILKTEISPTLVVKTPQNQPLIISYFNLPSIPVIDPPPTSRLSEVYEKGLISLGFNIWDLIIILLMLVFVISAVAYLSGEVIYGVPTKV